MLHSIVHKRWLVWSVLAIPAMPMMASYVSGKAIAMDLLHPTGEWSARLMIFAMILSPLASVIGPKPWLKWLVQRRRAIGVASFCYAMLHLTFYLIDMEEIKPVLAEIWDIGIWPGWAAMLLFLPLAITSNNASMRALKASWKTLQRLVYPTALLVLVHWIFIHNDAGAALVNFLPLIALIVARFYLNRKSDVRGAY